MEIKKSASFGDVVTMHFVLQFVISSYLRAVKESLFQYILTGLSSDATVVDNPERWNFDVIWVPIFNIWKYLLLNSASFSVSASSGTNLQVPDLIDGYPLILFVATRRGGRPVVATSKSLVDLFEIIAAFRNGKMGFCELEFVLSKPLEIL